MAGLKRKEAPFSKAHVSTVHKRSKKEAAQVKSSNVEPPTLEAETDSDPIVESDTTEHSGDDDGASWPSDGEEEVVQPSGRDETSKKQTVREDGSTEKPPGTNDVNTCKKNQSRYCGRK